MLLPYLAAWLQRPALEPRFCSCCDWVLSQNMYQVFRRVLVAELLWLLAPEPDESSSAMWVLSIALKEVSEKGIRLAYNRLSRRRQIIDGTMLPARPCLIDPCSVASVNLGSTNDYLSVAFGATEHTTTLERGRQFISWIETAESHRICEAVHRGFLSVTWLSSKPSKNN